MCNCNSSVDPGNSSIVLFLKFTPNWALASLWKSLICISASTASMYLVLFLTPNGSCEYAFISYIRSDIPLTTISTNLDIIGTGFQSKLR